MVLIWYHTRHSLNTKIIKNLQLTVQKGAVCFMYPCDAISTVLIVQSNFLLIHTNSGLHIKTCEELFNRIYGLQDKCKKMV